MSERVISNSVVVLLAAGDDGLAEACRGVSPRIRVVRNDDLKAEPALAEQVEIVYGYLSADRWAGFPGLRWAQVQGAGVDRLLTPEVVASAVVITNASGIHASPITEHMFGLLLAYNRRLFRTRALLPPDQWNSRVQAEDLPTLDGKTLGLLGLGQIGTLSGQVGRAFHMRVIGMRRSGQPHPEVEIVYTPGQLHTFLAEADVVMNTLPLTAETRGLIGAPELAAMKPGAVLVNAGRGGTVDTESLVAALRAGRPGAALLDVTDPEPLPAGHPLWEMDNVVITPHYSGLFAGYDAAAARIFLANLELYLGGQPLTNVVDKQAGY